MIAIKAQLQECGILFETNVPLKNKTWIKTGGMVALWITPSTIDKLIETIKILESEKVEFELVGHTSNLYYTDNYNPRVIISTILCNHFDEKNDYIECDCGVHVTTLSRYCVKKGFIGYSGLINLPGTVGAAIYNNSSCFGCSVSEHLIECIFYDLNKSQVVHLFPKDFDFSYRNSKLKRGELRGIILSIKLNKLVGDLITEKEKSNQASSLRRNTQEAPAYTLGSCFAGLVPKDDLIARFVKLGGKVLKVFNLYNKERYKRLMLFLYGFNDLQRFVSDKSINTFIWLPGRKDHYQKFKRYESFIKKSHKEPRLEIEIRDGK